MSDFKVIDTVAAWSIEEGDLFEAEGQCYRAIVVIDEGDSIEIHVESLDDALDDDELIFDAHYEVNLLDYNYDGVEV